MNPGVFLPAALPKKKTCSVVSWSLDKLHTHTHVVTYAKVNLYILFSKTPGIPCVWFVLGFNVGILCIQNIKGESFVLCVYILNWTKNNSDKKFLKVFYSEKRFLWFLWRVFDRWEGESVKLREDERERDSV